MPKPPFWIPDPSSRRLILACGECGCPLNAPTDHECTKVKPGKSIKTPKPKPRKVAKTRLSGPSPRRRSPSSTRRSKNR